MFKSRLVLIALSISLCATAAMAVRVEEDGLVSMEAERYDALVPGDGSSEITYEFFSDISGYSGNGYIRSMPPRTNVGNDTSRSDRVDYVAKISTPGTYYIWVRGYALADENSLHIGDPGGIIDTNVDVRPFAAWLWVGQTEIAVDQAGLVTVSVYVRESGCCLDKVVLTNDEGYTPTGQGPPESPDDAAGKVTSPSPASEATDVVQDTVLSWSAGEFAVTHNVYLGLGFDDVNDADENSPSR